MNTIRAILIVIILFLFAGCSRGKEYPSDIKELKEKVRKESSNISAYTGLVKVLFEKGYYEEASSYIKELLQISPDDFDGYLYSGLISLKLKFWDEAEKYFQQLCDKFPKSLEGHYYMALMCYEEGRYEDSVKIIERMITDQMIASPSAENSKDYVTLFAFFAWAYYYNGDMKKAYYMLDKALELDSSDTNALYDYGRWLLYDRKYKKCVKYCKEVIKHVPSEVFPYVLLGKAYYHMNQLQLAEQMFSNASRFDAKLKVFADIAHMHDMYGGYKSVNAAWVGVLEKYEYKLGDEYCVRGIVSNSGMDVAAKVSVIVRLYDEKGSILEQKAIEILPRNLNPEQYAFFVADFKYSCTISRSEIEINWSEKYLPQYILNKAEDLEAFRLR